MAHIKCIMVKCPKCQTKYKEREVKIIDIMEDMQGNDIVIFPCSVCNKNVRSFRFS